MAGSPKGSLKIIAVVVWIAMTTALAGWWFIFALRLIGQSPDLERQHRMLVTEGASLFVLLIFGGCALLYSISRENKRAKQIQIFFSSFTHDLKTSLASLRLQAEALEEDLKDAGQPKLLRRLVKDTVRLQLQLENSLYVANPESAALYIEEISLKTFFESLSLQWPDLQLSFNGRAVVKADPRALESVFKNLVQNAVVHGEAKQVTIHEEDRGDSVTLKIEDDGRGFIGTPEQVGKPFHKHHGSSGSGVGLYLVKSLVSKMGGEARFEFHPQFAAFVSLPKAARI